MIKKGTLRYDKDYSEDALRRARLILDQCGITYDVMPLDDIRSDDGICFESAGGTFLMGLERISSLFLEKSHRTRMVAA